MPGEAPGSSSATSAEDRPFWLARSTRTIFFFAVMLTVAGIYLAFQVPISVFPETNFPRVVIGVDNGVMPVEQMQVTITQPIEDAVNSVPGLETVRSTTSRGSAEVSLFFDWNVDMVQSLQLVDAALAQGGADAAADGAHHHQPAHLRHVSDSRLQPYFRHGFADAALGDGDLRSEAAAESRGRREHGDRAGRPGAGVSRRARTWRCMQTAGVTITDLVNAIQASNIVESPGLYEANHQLILGLVGAQVHDAATDCASWW